MLYAVLLKLLHVIAGFGVCTPKKIHSYGWKLITEGKHSLSVNVQIKYVLNNNFNNRLVIQTVGDLSIDHVLNVY